MRHLLNDLEVLFKRVLNLADLILKTTSLHSLTFY
jgi:hypothetical protein